MLSLPIIDYSMPKENNEDREEETEATISDTSKDIIKGMDRYEATIKSRQNAKHNQQATLQGLKNKLLMATNKGPKC
jgi:hypothetical protein